MPEKTEPLHELIHKLDKNEKRHFHLFADMYSKSGEAKQYVQLFDLIAAQKTYDEKAIKDKLSNKVFAGNLSSGKNFLYHMILRCLRHYHSSDGLRFRIREMWMDAYLLQKKGLLAQASKILDKAMKVAKTNGLYASYIDLSDLKRYIALDYEDQNKAAALSRLAEETRAEYNKLGVRLDILGLYEKGFTGLKDRNLNETEWEAIFEQYKGKLAMAEAEGQVFHDMLLYYQPGVQYYNYRKDYQATYEIDEKIISYLNEVDSTLIKDQPGRYFQFLTNFFNVCTTLNKPGRMKELIEFMEQVPPTDRKEKLQFQLEILYCQIILQMLTKNFAEVVRMAPEAEKTMQTVGNIMIPTRRRAILINIGSSFMICGKYEGALDWFGIMYRERDHTTVPLYQYTALLCFYVCHLELGNERFLDAVDNNIVAFLRKQHPDFRDDIKPLFFALRRYRDKDNPKRNDKLVLEDIVKLAQSHLGFSTLADWATRKLFALGTRRE